MSQMENACKQEYGEQRTCYSLIDWFFKDSAEWPDTAKHPQVCAGNSDPVSVGNNHSSFSKNPKIIPSLIFETSSFIWGNNRTYWYKRYTHYISEKVCWSPKKYGQLNAHRKWGVKNYHCFIDEKITSLTGFSFWACFIVKHAFYYWFTILRSMMFDPI